MKPILLAIPSLMMVGCLKPVPTPPEVPQVVVVMQVEPQPIIIEPEVDAGPLVKTWMSLEEIEEHYKARERAEKYGQCDCQDGDPACECIP